MMGRKAILLACALSATASAGASAASLSVLPEAIGGGNDFASDMAAEFGAGNVGYGVLTGVDAGGGSTFFFTRWGSESGYVNTFTADNGTTSGSLVESADPWGCGGSAAGCGDAAPLQFSLAFSGVLDAGAFKFTSNKGAPSQIGHTGMGLYYALDNSFSYAFLSYDDDGAGPDDNHDDFVVKVSASGLNVTPVPLPATAWLFLSALGGFVTFGRRKARS